MRRKIGCAVMAAGNARRFGRNKLEETVGGVRIIRRALEAVPRGELVRVVVVSQYAEIEALAAEYGFLAVHNGDPGAGLSHTVALDVYKRQWLISVLTFSVSSAWTTSPGRLLRSIRFSSS